MIGIKVQNSVWEKALLALLKEKAEIWQQQHVYQVVLTDEPFCQNKANQEETPFIFLGKTLPVPLTFSLFLYALAGVPNTYENNIFYWDGTHRQIKTKKNNTLVRLTQ